MFDSLLLFIELLSVRDKSIESLAEIHWAARFMINREYQRKRNSMQRCVTPWNMHTHTGTVKKKFTLTVQNDFDLSATADLFHLFSISIV